MVRNLGDLSEHELEQLVKHHKGETGIIDWLRGLEIGCRFTISNGTIRITKIENTPGDMAKYPKENLGEWPFPAESQLQTMLFKPEGSVAVLAPGPIFQVMRLLKYAYQHGGDAVGTCRSNTLGVERIVGNLVGNPNYAYLFMIGSHGVHRPERALLNLHQHGIDENGYIKAPDPWCHCLEILAKEASAQAIVQRFQNQVTMVDLIDEDISMPTLAFLLSLCHQETALKAEIKAKEYVLTARGAYKEDGEIAKPLDFKPEELAKIDTVSAGSYALTALVDVPLGMAYRMALGCVLEYGRPLIQGCSTEGLHVRNFGVSLINVHRKEIQIPNVLRGLGITSKADQREYLDAYSFWTFLVPFSTVLWEEAFV